MRKTLILVAAAVAVAPVLAQAGVPVAHKYKQPRSDAKPHVPVARATGSPGTANSANPAPNVPPIQTPQAPLRTP